MCFPNKPLVVALEESGFYKGKDVKKCMIVNEFKRILNKNLTF